MGDINNNKKSPQGGSKRNYNKLTDPSPLPKSRNAKNKSILNTE